MIRFVDEIDQTGPLADESVGILYGSANLASQKPVKVLQPLRRFRGILYDLHRTHHQLGDCWPVRSLSASTWFYDTHTPSPRKENFHIGLARCIHIRYIHIG